MTGDLSRIVLAAAALAWGVPAVAATQILTFSGTLNNNSKNNINNPFGTANSTLANQGFSTTLTYDPSLFANTGTCNSAPNASCTFTLSSIRKITQDITVGSNTQSYTLTSGTFTLNANGNDSFSFTIQGNQPNNQVFTLQGTNFTAAGGATANGFFPTQSAVNNPVFNNFTALPLQAPGAGFTQNTTQFYAQAQGGSITSLSASNVAPVPEPGTWAMMIGGFGVVGLALRRRRTRAAGLQTAG